jgi:hypothetical protein
MAVTAAGLQPGRPEPAGVASQPRHVEGLAGQLGEGRAGPAVEEQLGLQLGADGQAARRADAECGRQLQETWARS